MKEDPRYLQQEYKKQVDNTLYNDALIKSEATRTDTEKSLELERRTGKTGLSGRRQTGVQVLSGNKQAVFSDTRADGARNNNRPAGTPSVNKEATKMRNLEVYVPEDENDQTFFEWGIGSSGERGSEM